MGNYNQRKMKSLILGMLALAEVAFAQAEASRHLPDDSRIYNDGGRDWPGLCTTGQMQSPIDLKMIHFATDNEKVKVDGYRYSNTKEMAIHKYSTTELATV